MSGSVGKILEVAAVAAAAYFTAGGSLAASGAADASIGAAGAGTAAGYGGAALGGISDVAGGALYTAPAAAGFGGAAASGTLGAGLAAGTDYGIGTGLDASGNFIGTGAGSSPTLTGAATSPYTSPTLTSPEISSGSNALASGSSNPLSSTLDWLSKNKTSEMGIAKILGGLYLQGQARANNAMLQPIADTNMTPQQLQAIERSMAAAGYLGSGKMMAAIANGALGNQIQLQQYNNQVAAQKNQNLSTEASALSLLAGGTGNLFGWGK